MAAACSQGWWRIWSARRELPWRFRAKACPGSDPGWKPVRVKKTRQIKRGVRLSGIAAAWALVVFAGAALAQDYPKRPITMIVPFAAGGTSDVIARTVAEQMGATLGQPIVIENVAGAGGSTRRARAAQGDPGGYTIALGNAGTNPAPSPITPMLPFK